MGFTPAYTMEQGILKTFNRFRERAGLAEDIIVKAEHVLPTPL